MRQEGTCDRAEIAYRSERVPDARTDVPGPRPGLVLGHEHSVRDVRYAVDAGERTITVQMMLDVEWEPDLSVSAPEPPIKQITLRIETGKTYLLAARVDIDAPVEAQLDQSYWQPFVYRVD
jgi:hypothetical protein